MLMKITAVTLAIVCLALLAGCSGSSDRVMAPEVTPEVQSDAGAMSETHLWGYYEIYIDKDAREARPVLKRSTMFTTNITHFLNKNPLGLMITIDGVYGGPGYADIALTVWIKHPFPGNPQYNAYDVRGVFIGNGHGQLAYNSDLKYAVEGQDQTCYSGLYYPVFYADGYTRWFNPTEFKVPGLFGYTKGNFASGSYQGTATLNPYKYFADGLTPSGDLTDWLYYNSSSNGRFSSGATNGRQYYCRFPVPEPGIRFEYAVLANWGGLNEHPSNAPEAVACGIQENYSLYFSEATSCAGGDLNLAIYVFDWDAEPEENGVMEDYRIIVESDVLKAPHVFTQAEMMAYYVSTHYYGYMMTIEADNVTKLSGNECWVIIEYPDKNYKNGLGVPNSAGDDLLAAYFRYPIAVSAPQDQPSVGLELLTQMPASGWDQVEIEFNAMTANPPCDNPLILQWDFDGDMVYDEAIDDAYTGPQEHPVHIYNQDYTGLVTLKVVYQQDSTMYLYTPVEVHVRQTVLHHFEGAAGDGGMEVLDGPGWTFMDEYDCWDENGSQDLPYPEQSCTVLATPPMDIPTDASNIHLRLSHWGRVVSDQTSKDAGIIGFTIDDGETYVWNQAYSEVFTDASGEDFPLMYDDNLTAANYAACMPPIPAAGWQGTCWSKYPSDFWGSSDSPVESDWTCNALKGLTNVRFVFGFISGDATGMIPGWSIEEVEVYVEP